jgi:hypothetical protein
MIWQVTSSTRRRAHIVLILLVCVVAPLSCRPPTLPSVEEVPPGESLSIDGTWDLYVQGVLQTRMRIDCGRIYSVDESGVGSIPKGRVLVRDLCATTDDNEYRGSRILASRDKHPMTDAVIRVESPTALREIDADLPGFFNDPAIQEWEYRRVSLDKPDRFETVHVSVPKQKMLAQLDAREKEEFDHVTCELSLAPQWFKAQTRLSLVGSYRSEIRAGPLGRYLQSQVLLRLVSLQVILYPLAAWVLRRRLSQAPSWTRLSHAPLWTVPILPLALVALAWPVGWLLKFFVDCLSYSMTGTSFYVPITFVLSLELCAIAAAVIVASFTPLLKAVRAGETIVIRALGGVGMALQAIGTVLTVRELLGIFTGRVALWPW